MCSIMYKRSLQVRDGDMLLLPFQSGCEARIQTLHTCVLAVSAALPCPQFSAILDFPTLPRARHGYVE